MKRTLVLAVTGCLFCAQLCASPSRSKDSTAVFFTKKQFDGDSAAVLCNCAVVDKMWFFWSSFDWEAKGEIKLSSKEEAGRFQPRTIYGFYTNGRKYVYLASEKKYYAVLNDKLEVPLYIMAPGNASYGTNIVYVSPRTGELTQLIKKNLSKDFSSRKILLEKMLALTKELASYQSRYITGKKWFEECKEATYALK